jgi:hypothetical protein
MRVRPWYDGTGTLIQKGTREFAVLSQTQIGDYVSMKQNASSLQAKRIHLILKPTLPTP